MLRVLEKVVRARALLVVTMAHGLRTSKLHAGRGLKDLFKGKVMIYNLL